MTSRAKLFSLLIGTVFALGILPASANVAQVLPEMGDLDRWAAFTLGAAYGPDHLTNDAAIYGDVGVAGNGDIILNDNAAIYGNLYYSSTGSLKLTGNATITGAQINNNDALLDNGVMQAIATSNAAFALDPTRPYNAVDLSGTENITIVGGPGETVVLKLRNFVLRGGATFTLQGTATTTFIINVKNQFSLSGNSQINLSGGVQWDDVLFNVRGTGDAVTLNKSAHFQGILMANWRNVVLSGNAVVDGEVIANRILLSGNGRINHPPVTSP
jgi:hypothetical protein